MEMDTEQMEENNYDIEMETEEERQRRLRRKKRIEEMRREKKRVQLIQKCVIPAGVIAMAALVICISVHAANRTENKELPQKTGSSAGGTAESSMEGGAESGEREDSLTQMNGAAVQAYGAEPEIYGPFLTDIPHRIVFAAENTSATAGFGDEIISQYGVLIDVEKKTVLAQKEARTRINPASMTKILTVLTAAEELGITGEDWEQSEILSDTFPITIEITDYSFINDCSNVGFEVGEEVTVRDLFYGTILPSGGDAALGLACYVAGSHEAFVELMNKKLEELGLSESTHFTNCVGLYDKEHYSTVYDMAILMKTASDIPFCREVLSAHTYNTSSTTQHPDGLLISNWFLRRIEDKDTHGEVLCGKTGYVLQSGSCAASLATDTAGREYLCVTAGSSSSWQCIYDQVKLYQKYLTSE